MADSPLLGEGSAPGRSAPPRTKQDLLEAVQSGMLDASLRGLRVLSLQKAAFPQAEQGAALPSVPCPLPFITFPLPPFRLLPSNDPAQEVQAGSCMSWPCIRLAKS